MSRKIRGESDDDRIARQQREVRAYEKAHPELVPGTASHHGDPDDEDLTLQHGPYGGVRWDGLARMASAREAAGLPLDERDIEALTRYPNPPRPLACASQYGPPS